MTPYYSEETVYSKTDLEQENEDGVSILYYLQKIYPGQLNVPNWQVFEIYQANQGSCYLTNDILHDLVHNSFRWMEQFHGASEL